ncbi:hypothetical protein LTS08_000916 [Lithohypha guttulata]|nr:hypothetical protein LTS08_000916 [Lithohypha guttulata]
MTRITIPSTVFFSPRGIASPTSLSSEDTHTTTLFVTNLHCASCVSYAQDTIRPLHGIFNVDVSLLSHTVCIQHEPGLTSTIVDVLLDAAFEVRHVTTSDASDRVIGAVDVPSRLDQLKHQQHFSLFMSKARRKHVANCRACQESAPREGNLSRVRPGRPHKRESLRAGGNSQDLESGTTEIQYVEKVQSANSSPPITAAQKHVATISIVGMTCASCVNAVTDGLKSLDFLEDVQVSLLSNNAKITFQGTTVEAQRVVDSIEDVGFEASIDRLESPPGPEQTSGPYKAIISIEGMTCGACATAVRSGLEELEGLTSINVDLLGNAVTTTLAEKSTIDKVLETIEDLGFEGSLVELREIFCTTEQQFRSVGWEITGMYCSQCPSNIVTKLQQAFDGKIEIIVLPDLKHPRLVIRYEPAPPELTVRRIKYVIESADPIIVASVWQPPSMEERSQEVHRKESNRILRHLVFTLVAAIPSFIIGVVFMSFVSEDNPIRTCFEQPLWLGNATRMDWTMFLITTPVMFYGASIFHTRALKEIWALWRPKSTSVAYFSSLAILFMEASRSKNTGNSHEGMETRHSMTYFDTVTFLTLFVLCGKFLQAYSKSKTGDAVAMLGKLRPTTALLVDRQDFGKDDKSGVRSIPIDLLEVGDVVNIPHGSSPPTDGVIDQDGTFLFDESSLTGESKPAKKIRGDRILTGSVNVSDPVRIVVKELGGKSMLDQIINVVRLGQGKRAPIERFADVMTSYFTPAITLVAVLTWLAWLGLGQSGVLPHHWLDVDQGGWPFWSVEFAIAVFVVACPCGLGLAAPTALFVGGDLAAKAGILVQGGGEAFQEASQLNAIVFDKTGTLTEGKMRVTEMQSVHRSDEKHATDLALQLASIMEESSTHPIAKAISLFCQENRPIHDDFSISVVEVKELPGQGMRGTFNVRTPESDTMRYEAAIGNERQLAGLSTVTIGSGNHAGRQSESLASNEFLASTLFRLQASGCTTAILSIRRLPPASTSPEKQLPLSPFTPHMIFAITDPICSEAPSVLAALRCQNIEVYMCTGDNRVTAHAIASQLDIPVSNIRAGALPQDKAAYVQELQQNTSNKRRIVAFCGDGTNDTPALQAADVSIALSSGSDIALTSASFILLNSNLESISHLLSVSKRVFQRVKINFAWAAIYNVALIPVAAGVFFPISQWRLSPVWAAAAMAGSSVSVVLSSLALRLPEVRFRGWKRESRMVR